MGQRRTLLIAGLIGLAIIAFLAARGCGKTRPGPRGLSVSLTADPSWVPIISRTTLLARVEGGGSGTLRYTWTAADGVILGSGAKVQWLAPRKPGAQVVSVSVQRGEEPAVRAQVTIDVVDPTDTAAVDAHTMQPYAITSVKLDRDRICSTGDVRVTIEASDPGGTSQWLVPAVTFPDTETIVGFDVIGRLAMDQSRLKSGTLPVVVNLYDVRSSKVPVATRTVNVTFDECSEEKNREQLVVSCFIDYDEWNLMCKARHRDEDQPWFQQGLRQVEWRLEGQGAETLDGATVFVHPIPPASFVSDRAVHTWIVHARGTLADGHVIEGRGSVSETDTFFMNAAQVGKLLLQMANGVASVENGVMQTSFKIRNQYPEAVVFDDVEISRYPCTEAENQAVAPVLMEGALRLGILHPLKPVPAGTPEVLPARHAAPAQVLGVDRLEAGSAWHELIMKTPVEDGICSVVTRVNGSGETTGMPVELQMLVSTAPDTLVGLNAPNVMRDREAARILSREKGRTVYAASQEDILRLEREGKLRTSEQYVEEWKQRFRLGDAAQPRHE